MADSINMRMNSTIMNDDSSTMNTSNMNINMNIQIDNTPNMISGSSGDGDDNEQKHEKSMLNIEIVSKEDLEHEKLRDKTLHMAANNKGTSEEDTFGISGNDTDDIERKQTVRLKRVKAKSKEFDEKEKNVNLKEKKRNISW